MLKADVPLEDGEDAVAEVYGEFKPIAPKLPAGSDPNSLLTGVKQLLEYLQNEGYCERFEVSSAEQGQDRPLEELLRREAAASRLSETNFITFAVAP